MNTWATSLTSVMTVFSFVATPSWAASNISFGAFDALQAAVTQCNAKPTPAAANICILSLFPNQIGHEFDTDKGGTVTILSALSGTRDDYAADRTDVNMVEVVDDQNDVEYEIGFGYRITAAKFSQSGQINGSISGVGITNTADNGRYLLTYDWIGIADKTADSPDTPNVYAHLPITSDINSAAFASILNSLSAGLQRATRQAKDAGKAANYLICPQVLNARTRSTKKPLSQEDFRKNLEGITAHLKKGFNEKCDGHLPNVNVTFKEYIPNDNGSFQANMPTVFTASATQADKAVLFEYARRKHFWLFDKSDRFFEIWISGQDQNASINSLSTAIFSIKANKNIVRVGYVEHSGGTDSSASIPAIADPTVGIETTLQGIFKLFNDKKAAIDSAASQ